VGRSLIVPITVRVRGINPGAVSCSGTDVFREAITTGWNESRPKSVSQRLRARVNATWTVGAFTSSHLHFVCTDVTPDLAELPHRGQSQLIRVEAPPSAFAGAQFKRAKTCMVGSRRWLLKTVVNATPPW